MISSMAKAAKGFALGLFAMGSMAAIATTPANAAPLAVVTAASASDAFRIVSPSKGSAKTETALGEADAQFRSLFASWSGSGDATEKEVSIPSVRPVDMLRFTSRFGYRSDPFKGRRANHKGIDIGGAIGTPIIATADGIVGRAQWVSGYGKYVEINHGNQIQTRYGHMSALNVAANQRIKKGDVIGFMGSTGRSTGSHLHYEVRIAGEPVNPLAFMGNVDDAIQPAVTKTQNELLASAEAAIDGEGGPAE